LHLLQLHRRADKIEFINILRSIIISRVVALVKPDDDPIKAARAKGSLPESDFHAAAGEEGPKRGPLPPVRGRSGKMAAPAFNHRAFSRQSRNKVAPRSLSRYVDHEFKGTREDRGSQRRLTVLSLPGLLCDRSSSNGESVPDGREAVRTRAKPSPRRRPSCSAAPRETHPAALQQTDRTVAMMHRCITKIVRRVVCPGWQYLLARARARASLREERKEEGEGGWRGTVLYVVAKRTKARNKRSRTRFYLFLSQSRIGPF